MKHVSIRVSGRVQGVFFRATAKEKADELHISGSVRNDEDGSVFIEAEGEEDAIREFIAWCRKGPKLGRVDRCEVTERAAKNLGGFSILR